VAKRAGKTVEFVNIPFNGLFSAVQSKRVEIAISSCSLPPGVHDVIPLRVLPCRPASSTSPMLTGQGLRTALCI
jgi:ABC-type amino acid transport substrate-binding protein